MTGKEINRKLANDTRGVILKIFPNAKIKNNRAYVGDINGSEGDSLVIELAGKKAGTWCDFAAGGDEKGDLIELWTRVLCGGDYGKSMKQIREHLGLPSINELSRFQSTEERSFESPERNWFELDDPDIDPVSDYLVNTRKIPLKVLRECGVGRDEDSAAYVFPSMDDRGKLALVKTVMLHRDNGKKKSWTSRNSKPVLFGIGLPSPKGWDKHTLVITEGEIDALSFRAAGIQAVSVPFGAKNHQWLAYCHGYLQKFTQIIIAFDGDEEGISGRNGLLASIGNSICRVVDLPEGKDANDVLREHGANALRELIRSCRSVSPERFKTSRDIKEEIWGFLRAGKLEDCGDPIMGWTNKKSVRWNLRPRELTIWTGFPYHGKSAFIYQMIAHLICIEKKKVAIASLEVPSKQYSGLVCQAAIARQLTENDRELFDQYMDEVGERLLIYDYMGTAPIKDVIDFAEYAANVAGAHHFILDSVAKTDLNIEDHSEANKFMAKVTGSMFTTGAHYHLVAHSRKGDSRDIKCIPNIDHIKGSSCFGVEAFNVATIWRNIRKEEWLDRAIQKGDDEKIQEYRAWPDSKLVISKQKNSTKLGEYDLWFNHENYRFRRDRSSEDVPYFGPNQEDPEW